MNRKNVEEDIILAKKYTHLISYYFRKFKVNCESCHSKTEKQFHPYFNKLWNLIHSLPFKFKTEFNKNNLLKKEVIIFYNNFKYLPCHICRKHYNDYLKEFPIVKIKSNYDLQNWTIILHNNVNTRLNKRNYSYNFAKNKYINYIADI
tara:strand:+ start:272 stop:715 length:444 start_codon:yes stop_codon:yes gene_type:complete